MSDDKAKVIHTNRFMGGRVSPQDFFRQVVYAKTRCSFCGGPPAMRIKFLAPVDEFKRRHPQAFALLALKLGSDPSFDTKYGKMIHVESVFACDLCKTSARKAAAHKEDWVLVEFEEMGLDEKHPTLIQVPK